MTDTITNCRCEQDGFCQRFQRIMSGRFREICQGINVDLGTAAAFREQWRQDTNTDQLKHTEKPKHIILSNFQAPGDAVAMTAAIYSLHRAHPGKYLTSINVPWEGVFDYNPDIVPATKDAAQLYMHYPAIHQCNDRGIHFMQAWCEHLSVSLGVNIPLITNRPHLYFPTPDPPIEDFWVICSGGKRDFTGKLWGHDNYQKVVSTLHGAVRFVQVGGKNDDHQRLDGTEDLLGKTNLRQLFDIVRRARGVLCGVSLLMHVAAALERPAIIIAGGREPVQWNAYPKQQYVHTVGSLSCRDLQGHIGHACWRSRVLPLGDGSPFDNGTCEKPVDGIPLCMRIISPAEIAGLVLRYNRWQ